MSGLSKRPVVEDNLRTHSKRQKLELPAGFFDSKSLDPPKASISKEGDDDYDEEWERFQADMAGDSFIESSAVENKSTRRLQLLGLSGSQSIQADAILANTGSETATGFTPKPEAEVQINTANDAKSSAAASKAKIDKDSYAEEDAADGLLDQFETQEELYGRVDRMKELRLKQRELHKTEDNTMEKRATTNGSRNDVLVDHSMEATESDTEDEAEDEDEVEEEDLWRRRGL